MAQAESMGAVPLHRGRAGEYARTIAAMKLAIDTDGAGAGERAARTGA